MPTDPEPTAQHYEEAERVVRAGIAWADSVDVVARALAAAREARGQNDVPRHLRLAILNATRAFERDDFAALATINEDIQGLVDAAMASRRRAIDAAKARGFDRGRVSGDARADRSCRCDQTDGPCACKDPR